MTCQFCDDDWDDTDECCDDCTHEVVQNITAIGPVGPIGPAGPSGANSTVPGPIGPQGEQGIPGPVGPTGAASTVPGPVGPAGANGTNGVNGTVLPAGIISQYAGATVPTGWLVCDGAAKSRSAFAALFAAIGVTYGPGDGSTTFNLPYFLGKVPVALDPAGATEFNALAKTGGAINHAHYQTIGSDGTTPLYIRPASSVPTVGSKIITTNRLTISTGSATSGTARFDTTELESTLQPYLVVNFIIFAG